MNTEQGRRPDIDTSQAKYQEQLDEKSSRLRVENLFLSSNPLELEDRLRSFVEENKNNEDLLLMFADILYDHNLELLGGTQDIERTRDAGIVRGEDVRRKFDGMKIPKSMRNFGTFLQIFLGEQITVFNKRYTKHMMQEQESADQQKNQVIIDKATYERALDMSKLENMKMKVGANLIKEMKSRIPIPTRSIQDQKEIVAVEANKAGNRSQSSAEIREFKQGIEEQELLLAHALREEGPFGENVEIYHTDKFDDYTAQADLAVDLGKDGLILVDLTYSQNELPEKLEYNQNHPIRELKYPPTEVMVNKPGIPIVLAMTKQDAETTIDEYITNIAHERISPGSVKKIDSKSTHENKGRWSEYIIIQLRHQRDHIAKNHVQGNNHSQDYEVAINVYNKAINYFEKIKNGQFADIELNANNPLDHKIMYISGLIDDSTVETKHTTPPVVPEGLSRVD